MRIHCGFFAGMKTQMRMRGGCGHESEKVCGCGAVADIHLRMRCGRGHNSKIICGRGAVAGIHLRMRCGCGLMSSVRAGVWYVIYYVILENLAIVISFEILLLLHKTIVIYECIFIDIYVLHLEE